MDKGLFYGTVLVDDYPEYMKRWLAWRPRGLGIVPTHPHNADFSHPNVVIYDGSDLAFQRVRKALLAAFQRPYKGELLIPSHGTDDHGDDALDEASKAPPADRPLS